MKLSEVFTVSLDSLTSAGEMDLQEVTVEDKDLMQRRKLIESLESEDRQALYRIIDSMLTKQKILKLVTQGNSLSTQVTGWGVAECPEE